MKLEIDRYDFGRIVSRFGWLNSARKNDTGFVVDMIWEYLENSDLRFDRLQEYVQSLDIYNSVEDFAEDRLEDWEAEELLEDEGCGSLIDMDLERLQNNGRILAYKVENGAVIIVCEP
jgi:hypothetical protein